MELPAAYATCLRLARRHYENFPVASLLLPRHMRPHVAAVYAFARAADDYADEGQLDPAVRLDLLERWSCRLREAAAGSHRSQPQHAGEPPETEAIFVALGATVRQKGLPPGLLEDLLSAFRQDVVVTRYDTWESLFDYCRRSANPVGRLVLRIAGLRDASLDRLSDDICTALQLTNFWQDLKIDFDRGRIYLPASERMRTGAAEADLADGRITPAWQDALAAAVARTRGLLDRGRPLCTAMRGRLGCELRATWLGAARILNRLEASRFDVVRHRPTLGVADAPWLVTRVGVWSLTGSGPRAA